MTEVLNARSAPAGYHRAPASPVLVLGEKWIPREERCVASARRFVRDAAADWNTAQEVPEIAELLVSELVTNALTHGAAAVPTASTIHVTVSREGKLMAVDVHDSCTAPPRLRRTGYLESSGRGLQLVRDLSHDWGWTRKPHGKSVWFQLVAWP
ncbi:ATP-binding protein [Streptosporangium sp. NPDC000396]|uniref:ATP-binding protein n=1 Tax=Streptosporangium sp. NPDC000396 TaxID=3366185 RepID=UPI0036ACF74B